MFYNFTDAVFHSYISLSYSLDNFSPSKKQLTLLTVVESKSCGITGTPFLSASDTNGGSRRCKSLSPRLRSDDNAVVSLLNACAPALICRFRALKERKYHTQRGGQSNNAKDMKTVDFVSSASASRLCKTC